MAIASARHILVQDPKFCEEIKEKILSDEMTFDEAARQYSKCPSGDKGGDLGTFSPGQMVPEFDRVVFNDEIGVAHGPIQTQFGYHLIEITQRDI